MRPMKVKIDLMVKIKIICWLVLLVSVICLTACRPTRGSFASPEIDAPNDQWNTYTNTRYRFAIDYPAGWKILEVPNEKNPGELNQVWFTNTDFPPPQTGARADIVLIMTKEDPSPNWQSQFFDNYKAEQIQLGNVSAMKMSGTNREGKFNEIAVIVDLGEIYILAIPSHSSTSLDYFKRALASFRTINLGIAAPTVHSMNSPTAAKLAAGAGHTCLVTLEGTLKCWGHNGFGQLGNGESPLIPLENTNVVDGVELSDWVMSEVSELQGEILAITAGAYHTCVLTRAGGVKCWGQNAYGQLGDGTVIDRDRPVDVQGLTSDVAAVTAGAVHTCALMDYGGVMCWGQNNGLLGNDKTADSVRPVDVTGLSGNITQVHAGWVFTCALNSDGDLFCWGDGANGRFGDGSSIVYRKPIRVQGLPNEVVTLAVGQYHLCVLLKTDEVICWGALSSDQEYTSQQPFVVSGLTDEIVKLVAGGGHTCALTVEGGVKCWGDNYFGQLGDGTNLSSFIPVDVNMLPQDVVEIASGGGHVCALMAEGGIKCWGDSSSGQLGDRSLSWK